MSGQVFYFGAGPAMLPPAVLKSVQEELLDWQGQGISILEVGHRTSVYMDLMAELEALTRELLDIPVNYQLLFLGGPARQQFVTVPMNFLAHSARAGYLVSGIWSAGALAQAQKINPRSYAIATSAGNGYIDIPAKDTWLIKPDTEYLYYTPNETVNGVRFPFVPQTNLPLIADMTSCLLSESIKIKDYGLIFAGAQKNLANAGMTLVIISDELLAKPLPSAIGSIFDYRELVKHHSLYATPPTFNCYLALKVLHWLKQQGGVAAIEQLNQQKAAALYNYIDHSSAYYCRVAPTARAMVNVCFDIKAGTDELRNVFLEKAKAQGLLGLQGHREAGGLRASLYNAMPMVGVTRLIEFMQDFAEEFVLCHD